MARLIMGRRSIMWAHKASASLTDEALPILTTNAAGGDARAGRRGGLGAEGGSTGESLLTVRDLRKTFGSTCVLDDVSFDVGRGECVSILGPSGSGKSTLLRCLNGLEVPDSGEVIYAGERVPFGASARAYAPLRRQVGMVFQSFNLFPHLTALDNVALGPWKSLGLRRSEARKIAISQLGRVGLERRGDAYPAELSGGQQQRVAIARALALEPQMMLFDEATSALDPELVGEVLEVIRALARDGMTMITVTHEVRFASVVSDRAIVMDEGRIIEEGPAEFLRDPTAERTRRFLKRILHETE